MKLQTAISQEVLGFGFWLAV